MTITDEQLEKFTGQPNPAVAVLDSVSPSDPIFAKSSVVQDELSDDFWSKSRTDAARASLHKAVGVGQLHPPTEVEQQNRLNLWWKTEGQLLPRHVLDEIGIVGGESLPSIKEAVDLQGKQRLGVVKDFLGIERPQGKDPLGDLVSLPEPADPSDAPDPLAALQQAKPEMADIIKATEIEDLKIVRETMLSNPLEFEDGLFKAASDEIKIKELRPQVLEALDKAPLTLLLGTDFFNTLGFNLPEFTSRKGFSPTENLLGLEKGSESIFIRAVARLREEVVAQDPTLLAQIGVETGGIAADLIKFAVLPNVSKAGVFASLSPAAKAAIGVGTKAGLIELLQAPTPDEDVAERFEKVALATGIGALTGVVLDKIVTFVKDIPVNRQAAAIVKKFPQFKKGEVVEILKTMKENRLISLKFKQPVPVSRRVAPKGFRVGAAEIEKPAKLAAQAARKAAKSKEATVIEAAKAIFAVKTQPAKAVRPTVVITKAEAAGLKEIGALGEGEKLRIVANPQLKKSIQTAENEIAKLKTRRNTLLAEKKFAVAKTKRVHYYTTHGKNAERNKIMRHYLFSSLLSSLYSLQRG